MRSLSAALLVGSALCAANVLPVAVTPAAAMPLSNLAAISRDAIAEVQNVGVVCGPSGCWSRPDPYPAPLFAPRIYSYTYGYGGYGCDGCTPPRNRNGYQTYGWYNGWGYRGLYRGFWY